MRNVPLLDASGIRVLDDLHRSFAQQGVRFVISGIPPEPLAALERAGRIDVYGRENIVASLDDALSSASFSARPSAAESS
jgi:SulP family sulfate permease